MSIASRLAKLEARAPAPTNAPTAAEAEAAWRRVVVQVRQDYIARVTGTPLPPESEEYKRDRETVERYRAAIGYVPVTGAKERLKAKLDRMAEIRAADLARGAVEAHRTTHKEGPNG